MSDSAAVIVTYFPGKDSIENLKKVSRLCDKIIVIDNTPERWTTELPGLQNMTLLKCPENVGLASGLNQGIRLACRQGLENVFLFDQDSRPSNDFFENMLTFKWRIDNLAADCALYVPNSYDRNSRSLGRFPLITPFTLKHLTCQDIEPGTINWASLAITSGTLITCLRYTGIGPLRDDYFIDFVDNEYCLRISKLGFRIAVNCDVILDHAIGEQSIHQLCGIKIKSYGHLPIRKYYISRNGIRTAIDYLSAYPSYSLLVAGRLVNELISVILWENNKLTKIQGLARGTIDGLVGKMGKCHITSLIPRQELGNPVLKES
jgi:rhamnosyltransferase